MTSLSERAEIFRSLHVPGKPAFLMVSTEGIGSHPMSRLERAGLVPGGVVRWGTESAYAAMLERRPAMLLLNAPTEDTDLMTRLVRAASLVAPVVILRDQKDDVVAAFGAGACDVLDAQAPIAELTWRIHADLRRRSPLPPPAGCPGATASQRLLFHVLATALTVVCCHQLRLLLGTPGLPMTLRALRARIRRLLPAFQAQGLELVVDQQWGLATYRTRAAGSTACGEFPSGAVAPGRPQSAANAGFVVARGEPGN